MSSSGEGFSIRSFRPGDEEVLAAIYNSYARGFFGPGRLTGRAWREQFREQSWTGPSVEKDRDCVRIAEREGGIVGYAVTDYQPIWMRDAALIQELCVAEEVLGEGAEQEVMEALIEDVEHRARERGKMMVLVGVSPEDGLAQAAAQARGFESPRESAGVFMAAITDVHGFLSELAPELSRRLGESEFSGWCGVVELRSGKQASCLEISNGSVGVSKAEEAERGVAVSATITEEALPLLLLGRRTVQELYLEDALSAEASDGQGALRLVDALFPRLPVWLPRAQWW